MKSDNQSSKDSQSSKDKMNSSSETDASKKNNSNEKAVDTDRPAATGTTRDRHRVDHGLNNEGTNVNYEEER